MADRSLFRFMIDAFQAPPDTVPFGAGVTARREIDTVLTPGQSDNQHDVLLSYDETIAASGTLAVDLKTSLDRYGVACNLNDVVGIMVENVDDGLGGVLELRPNAVNGWTNYISGTTPAQKIPKGSLVAHYNPKDARLLVTAANKAFDVVETGGALSAHVRVIVLGRR